MKIRVIRLDNIGNLLLFFLCGGLLLGMIDAREALSKDNFSR
jgi:hypothetical protein